MMMSPRMKMPKRKVVFQGNESSTTPLNGPSEWDTNDSDDDSKRRTVSFDPRVRTKKTWGMKNLSPYEISILWYDEEELEEIRLNVYATVKRHTREMTSLRHTNSHPDEEVDCLRGLEHQIEVSRDMQDKVDEELEVEVEDMKLLSRKLVLDEQERQTAQGVHNPDTIALHYAAVAKSRQATARARGEMDEAVAMYLIRQQVQQLKQEAADWQQGKQQQKQQKRGNQKSSPSKEQLDMERELQQKAKLGEVENCQNRAKLLLARRREHMRKVAGSAA
jgi:hypothetical protein